MGDVCPCWDGLFKGTYSLDKKSVMFNIDSETLGIFALTVTFICVTYAAFKTGIQLYFDGHFRAAALLPVLANVHGECASFREPLHRNFRAFLLRGLIHACAGVYYHWYVSFTYMNESWYAATSISFPPQFSCFLSYIRLRANHPC